MSQTAAEVNEARNQLTQLNEELGFRKPAAPAPVQGGSDHLPEQTDLAAPPAPQSLAADPGPPRFIGVDIEHALAGLAGGAAIPISAEATSAIVDVLCGELRIHLDRTMALVRAAHAPKADPAPLEIPFDAPRAEG